MVTALNVELQAHGSVQCVVECTYTFFAKSFTFQDLLIRRYYDLGNHKKVVMKGDTFQYPDS